jgi:heat shock protein HslJ
MKLWRALAGACLGLAGALPSGCMSATTAPASVGERVVTFTCQGGERLTVRFLGGKATLVDPQGRSFALTQQETGSGILYAGQGQTLRGKGEAMTWTAAGREPEACSSAPPSPLAGSRWRLVQFRAPDGRSSEPVGPERYVMELMAGGQIALQLDCNRAAGRWQASGTTAGSITIDAAAMTRAACVGESWDTRLARDLALVHSFTLNDDRLDLALDAGAGVYSWTRLPPAGG